MTDNDARRIEDKVDGLREAFAELRGALAPTLEKINDRQASTEGRLDDLEERVDKDVEPRLRTLERFRYSIPSLSVLSLLVSLAMLTYYLTAHHH